jgi:orotate phosphoribosyltransferase
MEPQADQGSGARNELVRLLARHSLRTGSFRLASGRASRYYIDARLTTMRPEGLSLIGPLALSTLRAHGWEPEAVGGLTLGADPVAYAIAYASASRPPAVRAFTVRKEPKEHGAGKLIEGPLAPGDRVVVVEDVITSGGSALRAARAVQAAGGVVLGVLAVVDREEGGRQALEAEGLDVIALIQAGELLALDPRALP